MKFKFHIYFNYRKAKKDPEITGQTQVGSTIVPTPRACSHTLLIRTWINKCLAENRKGKQALVVPLKQEEEMIVEEPTPALKGEPEVTKLFPTVSYNDVGWMPCDKKKVLHSSSGNQGTVSPFNEISILVYLSLKDINLLFMVFLWATVIRILWK